MDEQSDDNLGLNCALEMFSEVDEVLKMISNLKIIYCQSNVAEKAYDRFVFILHQYFEQPHLLDPHLDKILQILIDIIRDDTNPIELKHETFKYMSVFVKVRGYKIVIRHLPHEVSDFEPVLKFLESLDPGDSEIWRSRYVLLIWMSIIVMLPFHMSRLDQIGHMNHKASVMERVLSICKTYSLALDACRDVAVFLTSKFLSRSDVKEKYLEHFLNWAKTIGSNSNGCIFARYGAMANIACILKHGKRDDLISHANDLLKWILSTNFKESQDRNILKYSYKIIQRIGLVLLKPRVVSWRYKRGNRSLQENLSSGDSCIKSMIIEDEIVDDDYEIPDEIEEVLDELMNGLRNNDGVVRWSVAKGIGRVTGRLPQNLADEVVASVLSLFRIHQMKNNTFMPVENDGAWHGGCLTLAELGRRGLLLPHRLPEVVPVVLNALNYDIMKGYSSVGAHVRDAACYVCWAFARAYSSEDLAPFVPKIASALLIVAVFDREINCRRAASAAFQENVGRQGTFPHGIDILTKADFFTVGVRNNTYLQISVSLAEYPEYCHPLINHLLKEKFCHWDQSIRELTARALHNLTPISPKYMLDEGLTHMCNEASTSYELNRRHGSILAIGEIIYALAKLSKNLNLYEENFVRQFVPILVDLIPKYNEKLYFRGLGGELMKQACSDLIEKLSYAHFPVHHHSIINDWYLVLEDCLSNEVPSIRQCAIKALPALFNEYFQNEIEGNAALLQPKCGEIIQKYVKNLESHNEFIRMGYALAIGSLPKFMLQKNVELILSGLIQCATLTSNSIKYAQSRRDSIKAITQICVTLTPELYGSKVPDIYECFLGGLNDYTQDTRGDIGAWVRESAMTGLQTITTLLVETEYLNGDFVERTMKGIAKQAVERIDRTRSLAGQIFTSLLYYSPEIKYIPNAVEVKTIFSKEICTTINWNSEGATFPLFVDLLQLPTFTYSVLFGLIISVGGLTEGLVKHSQAALFDFFKKKIDPEKKDSELNRICNCIITIFEENQHIDRIIVPMFGFLDRLFNSGCIQTVLDNPNSTFASTIFNLLRQELNDCKNTYKLIDGINVLCQLIQVKNDVGKKTLGRLSMFLCHRQKYIRKTTASKLFESLVIYGDCSVIPVSNLDEAMTLLSNTDWEQSVEILRPIRNELCNLLSIKPPVIKPIN